MNYYLDTEFIEGKQTKKILGIPFGKTIETIDLISIGIVAEDGRKYYAVCNEFNLDEAWHRTQKDKNGFDEFWIRKNVLIPIYNELAAQRTTYEKTWHWELSEPFSKKSMAFLLKCYAKSKEEIVKDIVDFIYSEPVDVETSLNYTRLSEVSKDNIKRGYLEPKFYTYHGAYDHVVFCWLFGVMNDLPKGFPMYTRDLKYLADLIHEETGLNTKFPKFIFEHNALADAQWNKEFHEFLLKFKDNSPNTPIDGVEPHQL